MYLKYENLYIWFLDISPIWYNLLSIEFGPIWTKCDLMFSNLMLSWAVATDQKFYCKCDDHPLWIQEYPKLCVLYTGWLTTISTSKRTPNNTLCAFPNFQQSAAMTHIGMIYFLYPGILYFLTILAPSPVTPDFLQCPL
jgi:hypothetical protein